MERRTECCIDRCLTKSKSVKVKDFIYYLYPTDEQWAAGWVRRIKEYDSNYRRKINDVVCSLHFAKECIEPISRHLYDHAMPVRFPKKPQPELPLKATTTNATDEIKSAKSRCCIDGCLTIFENSDPKILGFKFPDNAEHRKNWTFFIKVYNEQILEWEESMKVCALHFIDTAFIKPDQLSADAKPTIFKSATNRRKKEIERQQLQAKNQPKTTMKTSSINVPLHRANAENQSMTRRSAPGQIMSRRFSLPYAKLPKLLPKPNAAKQTPSTTQINAPNGGLINVHRISSKNVVLTSASVSATPKPTLRPVPGLNKVINAANMATTNGQPNPTKPNVVVLRRSMPASSINALKSMKVKLPTTTSTATIPEWVPVKRARMPPMLTPAPQGLKLPLKTYSKNSDSLPIISRVASMGQKHTTPSAVKQCTSSTIVSSSIQNRPRLKTTTNDEDDPELIKAIMESKFSETSRTNEETATTSTIAMNSTNGTPKCLYTVKDENFYLYPQRLLERISENKRKNDELEIKYEKLKQEFTKLEKESVARRLKKAKIISETIEIS